MRKIYSAILLFVLAVAFNANAQTYNYYFGNIHAHSSYSDGNEDSSSSHLTKPLQDFNYAKASQHVDFYGISEHNHASAGLTSPKNFHYGMADADSATVDGSFIAMYGMEWGVISGGGHVIIYGYDSLIGWDNLDYDVFVAQNDYANLWKKVNEKPGSFAYLAHPQTTDYSNLFSSPLSLSADNAIVGMAARSGPAFSTNTSYSDPSTSTYIARYNDALKLGYHVGVGLDHDTHNSVFGRQTSGRLVVLANSLTRANILDAIKNMRFYSSDDWNVKVNFTIGNKPMGSIITQVGTPTITASITDPDASETVSSISIYYGIPGSGTTPTVLNTASGSSTLSYTHNIANGKSYYYYLKITQGDGNIIWTSPIWYTRNDAVTNTPPLTDFVPSATAICVGQPITFNDNSTNAPTDWNWTLAGGLPATSTNQSVVATYYTPGTYTVSLTAYNSFGAGATITKTITITPKPTLVAPSITLCDGQADTLFASGANSYVWNTGETTSSIIVNPISTTSYTVTGSSNGCSSTVTVNVILQTCTGIDELTKNTIKIFPNPANQLITIDASFIAGKKTIEIYNVLGQLMLSKTSSDNHTNVDLTSFENGNYSVKVIGENNIHATEHFIIQKK